MTIKGLLIGVLAIVGLGVLANAAVRGGDVNAHGGDDSLLHLCVGKWGSLKAAYVVSPNTNCPGGLFDSVHVELSGGSPNVALPQSCPDGQVMTGRRRTAALPVGS